MQSKKRSWQTCLVTGGAGFIGSHLVDQLLKVGKEVIVLDNLSTGKKSNIDEIHKIDFIEASVSDETQLLKQLKKVDTVFHLAACVSVQESVENPLKVHAENALATLKLFELCRNHAPDVKIIQSVSSAVYGDFDADNLNESLPLNPKSMYGLSKAEQELYGILYKDNFNIENISLRYFNVYGPKQAFDSQYAAVIPKFFEAATKRFSPTIFGTGEQTRDFVFVEDVVNANMMSANCDFSGLFNVGTGESITINQLWNIIAKKANLDVLPNYQNARIGDIQHSVANIQKIKSELAWSPQKNLEDGLTDCFDWYCKHIQG